MPLGRVWLKPEGAELALSVDLRLLVADDGRFSISGGGVGGNIDLLIGGSDCSLVVFVEQLVKPGLTRLSAA